MPKVRLRAATLGGSADEVEVAFYEASQTVDIEALMACRARHARRPPVASLIF